MNSSNISWSLEIKYLCENPGSYNGRISFHFDVVAHMKVGPEKKVEVCKFGLEDIILSDYRIEEALRLDPSLEDIGKIQLVALSEFGQFFTGILGVESEAAFEKALFYLHQEPMEDEMYLYCDVNLSIYNSIETCIPCSREIMENLYQEGLGTIRGAIEEYLDQRTENL